MAQSARSSLARPLLRALQQQGQRRAASGSLSRRTPAITDLRSSTPETTRQSACLPTETLHARHASSRARPATHPDRGPTSSEHTQTDFNTLDVLGATAAPTSAIDECSDIGFLLDSGLRITDGDGVMLIGGEAFVWRPWMAASPSPQPSVQPPSQILRGVDLVREGNGTGGLIAGAGTFSIPSSALGLLGLVWPKPDLLIIGTGARIVPLEKATRERLQEYGVRIEVLDTRNAASQFNLLATERGTAEVVAAMVPCGFGVRQIRKR